MKTPTAILLGCLLTCFGAFADSGKKIKKQITVSQEKPKSFCEEINKSIEHIGKEFDDLDKEHFFDHYFEGKTDMQRTGIYLFRNYRGLEEKKAKEQKA